MPKKPEKIPEEFKTYDEAAEFWDTHDSTDYLEYLEEVEMNVDIQKKHYLIELDMNTVELLEKSARKKGVPISFLANELIQKQLAEA
jgi:hypothetical protein